MAARVCSTPGCPVLLPTIDGTPQSGRCPQCRAEADRGRRPHGSVYGTAGHQRFRDQVLGRDPVCVTCLSARSTVADHAPMERQELIDAGLDPNDPEFGQGLCKKCHDSKTAKTFGFGGSH